MPIPAGAGWKIYPLGVQAHRQLLLTAFRLEAAPIQSDARAVSPRRTATEIMAVRPYFLLAGACLAAAA